MSLLSPSACIIDDKPTDTFIRLYIYIYISMARLHRLCASRRHVVCFSSLGLHDLNTRCRKSPPFFCWALNVEVWCYEVASWTVIFPVTWGIRPWGWCLSGGRAQRSRCGCLVEGVPEGHARPTSHQGAVHSFHQHSLCVLRPLTGTWPWITATSGAPIKTLCLFCPYLFVSDEWAIWGIF